jgi:hypothetical protein
LRQRATAVKRLGRNSKPFFFVQSPGTSLKVTMRQAGLGALALFLRGTLLTIGNRAFQRSDIVAQSWTTFSARVGDVAPALGEAMFIGLFWCSVLRLRCGTSFANSGLSADNRQFVNSN